MNIFRIDTIHNVGCKGFVFCILQVVDAIDFVSSLLCVNGNGGISFCRIEIPMKL